MSKTIQIPFAWWRIQYNGIVPTGNSDYSANHEYVALIRYQGKVGEKELIQDDKEYFESRKEALAWIDKELDG